MSRIFKLYRLQQVDTQLDQVLQRLQEIEKLLGNDEELNKALAKIEETKGIRLDAEKALRYSDEEVKAQQIKIEQNQSTLYSGKVIIPKELQDLQLEAEALKRKVSDLEDAQFEKMIKLESDQSDEEKAAKALHKLQVDREKQHGDLIKEQSALNADQARLESEAKAAASAIDDEDMLLYMKTRGLKNGVAVAKLTNNTCTACGNQLSQALAQAARSPDEINRCSICKRIIYAG